MSKSEQKTLAEIFIPIDESFETEDGGMDEQQQSCNLSVGAGFQKPQRYRPSASIIDRRANLPLRIQAIYASGPFTPPVFQPYVDMQAPVPVIPVAAPPAQPKKAAAPKQNIDTERDSFTAKVIRSPSKMSRMDKTALPIPARSPSKMSKMDKTALPIPI
ncbi:hypothetical protein PRIPAC_82968 [Pristionchus pacificus]|uniref:Uncharacterized protein n=1 Tax=Pristionchus pacificus TaxID=54126 RepID=A0A454XZ55_PRIPA|nr:hypothetical protein PRIPAC_82968 [Pristionchus pacificus]|eukprot:PDM70851.1 hypothetical protein PRIPAC_45055 [Pristionchus pacificus]